MVRIDLYEYLSPQYHYIMFIKYLFTTALRGPSSSEFMHYTQLFTMYYYFQFVPRSTEAAGEGESFFVCGFRLSSSFF